MVRFGDSSSSDSIGHRSQAWLTPLPPPPPARCPQVFVWCEKQGGGWDRRLVYDYKVPTWRVSWSTTGTILAVTDGNNAVTLWKESMDGVWQKVNH